MYECLRDPVKSFSYRDFLMREQYVRSCDLFHMCEGGSVRVSE